MSLSSIVGAVVLGLVALGFFGMIGMFMLEDAGVIEKIAERHAARLQQKTYKANPILEMRDWKHERRVSDASEWEEHWEDLLGVPWSYSSPPEQTTWTTLPGRLYMYGLMSAEQLRGLPMEPYRGGKVTP